MIWFVIAAVLIAAGAVMIRLSRAGVASPPLSRPRQEQRENLFEPSGGDESDDQRP
jgi:hypothetical protein